MRSPNGARPIPGRRGRRWLQPTARPAAVFCLGLGDRRWRSSSATAARHSWRSLPDVACTLLDFGISRARPLLESARKRGPRLPLGSRFLARAKGGAPRQGFRSGGAGAAAMGTLRREPIETAGRGVAAACVRSGISGWVIGLLIGWRAGAERRAANSWSPWSPMLADGEARRRFLFGTWRSAVAELFGNSRSQQLAGGKPSDVLALCWMLASAERDRSLNLLGKGGRVPCLGFVSPRTRGRPLGQRFRFGGAGASYGDSSARADRNRWPRGGCGVCALWHFRLGDRALDRLACGRRTARGQRRETRRLLSNRPGPNFDAESNSKRTATRQQLDLQRLLCNQTVEL